ncbi:hypothetical protein GCM10010335_15100 [Streptomyces galbus]|nr:hypothetical protein GCM10010335_15100 [Streptomyces galbus]
MVIWISLLPLPRPVRGASLRLPVGSRSRVLARQCVSPAQTPSKPVEKVGSAVFPPAFPACGQGDFE